MEEIWKEYKTYNRYGNINKLIKVSNLGNATGYIKNKEVFVEIKKDGRRTIANIPIYILVDKLFNGPLPKGYIVHHKDHNKLNDNLDNLERLTISEHMKIHNYNLGTRYVNNLNPKATLGMHWFNNGKVNKMFKTETEAALKGFVLGRINVKPNKNALDKMHNMHKNTHWYNNGKNNKHFLSDEDAKKEGYVRGKMFSHRHNKEGWVPWNKKNNIQ